MKAIIKGQHKSEHHKASWVKYENTILYYRSNACQFFLTLYTLFFSAFGEENYQNSEKILQQGEEKFPEAKGLNYELAEAALPVGKWIHIVGMFLRVLLLAISYYRPGVCKLYIYFELLLNVTDQLMVSDVPRSAINLIMLLKTTMFFYNLYYELKPSLVAIFLSQAAYSVIHFFIYNEAIKEALTDFFIMTCWLLIAVLIAHIVVTAAGFLFTEAEFLRKQLLNQMDEGLIIIDEDYEKVLFENKKAARIGGRSRGSFMIETNPQDSSKVVSE